MPRHEIERVIAALPGTLVAARTERLLGVTPRAIEPPARRDRPVRAHEIRGMRLNGARRRRIDDRGHDRGRSHLPCREPRGRPRRQRDGTRRVELHAASAPRFLARQCLDRSRAE